MSATKPVQVALNKRVSIILMLLFFFYSGALGNQAEQETPELILASVAISGSIEEKIISEINLELNSIQLSLRRPGFENPDKQDAG